MTVPLRPEALAVEEAIHGGAIDAASARTDKDCRAILDFSANINPFGPSPRVSEALATAKLDCYPDRDARLLRRALSARLSVPMDCLLAGNGSSELLYLIALAYFRPQDAVVIAGPTYSEYARATALMGARSICCDASEETQFEFPTGLVAEALRRHCPRAVFVCHPNNPTGRCAPLAALRQWLDDFPRTLFVVDEAYWDFAMNAASAVDVQRENLVVLRSLTKAHALAGVRLGYAVAHADIIRALARVRPPWSVSAVAQAAGVAALDDVSHLDATLAKLRSARETLSAQLAALGLCIVPSAAHFFLVRTENATQTTRRLLATGVLVRDCTSMGLPRYVRVSPRSAEDNAVLCEAWKRLPAGG